MILTEALKSYAESSAKRHTVEAQKIMKNALNQLVNSNIINKAFKTGDRIPTIELPNAKGTLVAVNEILRNNRVVLTFYRGTWCPYCNLELRALQEALPLITEKGAQLIAISPQTPDHTLTTKEKNELAFEVLSDADNAVARKMNLVYELPAELLEVYASFGINLAQSNANLNGELPIAATYIIEMDGTISYHYVTEDYKLRADPEAIIDAL